MAYERGDGTGGSSKTTPLATLVSSKKKKTTSESYKKAVEEYTKWYRGDSSASKSNGFQNSTYTSFVPISGVQNPRPAPQQQQQQQRGGQKSPPASSQQKRESGGYKPSRSGGGGKSTATARAYNEGYRDAVRFNSSPYTTPSVPQWEPLPFPDVYGDSMPDPWRRGYDVRSTFRKNASRVVPPSDIVYPERRETWRPSRAPQQVAAQPALVAPPAPPPGVRGAFSTRPSIRAASPYASLDVAPPPAWGTSSPYGDFEMMPPPARSAVRQQIYLPMAPIGRWR
jgi:hypothetical protein